MDLNEFSMRVATHDKMKNRTPMDDWLIPMHS